MQLMIQIAQEVDIPSIQTAAAESWRATYADIFTSEFIERFLASAYSVESLRRAIAREDSLFLVAKLDDQVVGFAQVGESQGRHERVFALYRLYILPAYWRQAIGARLLAAVEHWLKARGATGYFCYVHGKNEVGKGFYQKNGFIHEPAQDHDGEWYMWKALSL